jgi:MATE family multidrug resistance protein
MTTAKMDSKESRGELQEPLVLSSTEPETNDHYHEADSRLENVLNDTNLSYFMRLGLASWIELKLLFRLAAPAVFVYLINNSLSLSTRIFSGHLGNLEFAAVSLANSGVQLFVYGLMVIS